MAKSECEAVYLFISELTGSFIAGSGTIEDKIKCGINNYLNNELHELDLTTEEGRKELNENIWLERLYNELDEYFEIPKGNKLARCLSIDTEAYRDVTYQWSVPIELDASASLLQIMGILLNDKRLMEMTNVIGSTLEDPWKLKGISRSKLKCVMTPKLYGSSQSPEGLWKKGKMPYTDKDVKIVTEELQNGAFGLANSFKDFIINNCSPKSTMEIKIGDDEFSISCNKFRNTKEVTKAYKIYDSIDKQYNIVLHTDTKKVEDLEQFRLYMMTLLVHNIDSQIMDSVVGKVMKKYGWGISVHDAILCGAQAAADVRTWYNEELLKLHTKRKDILKDFFKSVGINASCSEQWTKLQTKIVPFTGNFEDALSMPLK